MNKFSNFLKQPIKNWLIHHPSINPYKLSLDPGFCRWITGYLRYNPSFSIIGGQKCGTTSLHDYLIQHPSILPSSRKEIGFFDTYYNMGFYWYRCHFPLKLKPLLKKELMITGDSSPNYLFHPHVGRRIYKKFPNMKLIVLLRNPVDRAYSHYQMQVRKGFEFLSFEDAINSENQRLKGEKKKILENVNYYSYNYEIFSYLERGKYFEQLKNWYETFPKNQILVLSTEEFNEHPTTVLSKIFKFLNLKDHQIPNLKRSNVGKYFPIKPSTRDFLKNYFQSYNEQLYKLLEKNFNWE